MTEHFSTEKVTVTSIGGGPDTDLFGIIAGRKRLFEAQPDSFHFYFFDKEIEWRETADKVIGDDISQADITWVYNQIDLDAVAPENERRLV